MILQFFRAWIDKKVRKNGVGCTVVMKRSEKSRSRLKVYFPGESLVKIPNPARHITGNKPFTVFQTRTTQDEKEKFTEKIFLQIFVKKRVRISNVSYFTWNQFLPKLSCEFCSEFCEFLDFCKDDLWFFPKTKIASYRFYVKSSFCEFERQRL